MNLLPPAAVILWGAWVSLDERAWGSWAVHQPLVAGTVAGWILGDVRSGLTAGFLFQALWPGLLPIGGALLPASGLGALTAASVCALAPYEGQSPGPWPAHPLLLPASLTGLAAAWVGRVWEQGIRRRNAGREDRALASETGWPAGLDRAFRTSILESALRGAITAGLVLGGSLWARRIGLLDALAWNEWVAVTGDVLPLAGLGFGLGLAVRWLGDGRDRKGRERGAGRIAAPAGAAGLREAAGQRRAVGESETAGEQATEGQRGTEEERGTVGERKAAGERAAEEDRPGPEAGGWLRPFLRLFGLETLFNARGQQRGGMMRAVRAGVPDLPPGHPVFRELAQAPISTNPILSGYLAGILIRRARLGDPGEPAGAAVAVERCRTLLGPVVAASGDRLFWGRVRPALSLTALFSALFWTVEPAILYWLGYNATQVYWRRRSLRTGLMGEQAVSRELRARRLDSWSLGWDRWARVVVGVLLVIVLSEGWRGLGPAGAGLAAAAGVLGWAVSAGKRIGVLGAAALALALAMGFGAAVWIAGRGLE